MFSFKNKKVKLLVFGDVVGRVGRAAIKENLNTLKAKYSPDFIIANGENLTSGRGPIEKHVLEMKDLGIDLLTGGNHSFDNETKISEYMKRDDCILLRPANFYESEFYQVVGKGYTVIEKEGKRLLVINLMSSSLMRDDMFNPFLKVDEILKEFENEKLDGIIVDFHRETTSEIYAMSFFLEGRASLVYGTHTHIQTNDEMILPGGTALLGDVGMTGSQYSVIGADYESVKKRFLTGIQKGKIDQDLGSDYVLNGMFVEIEEGKAIKIEKIRIRKSL